MADLTAHTTEIKYSADLIQRAAARYNYQKAFVASMDRNVDQELALRERELLSGLEDKLKALTALHERLIEFDRVETSRVHSSLLDGVRHSSPE